MELSLELRYQQGPERITAQTPDGAVCDITDSVIGLMWLFLLRNTVEGDDGSLMTILFDHQRQGM